MLSALVRAALTQRIFVLGVALALIAAGIFATLRLPIDAFPDISTTQVKLILKAPGMTPEEVEQRVVAPLEMELLGIPKQRVLRSVAKYAIADITIDFEDSVDIYWARQQVSERLAAAADAMGNTVSPTVPNGVFKSIDGGATWVQKSVGLPRYPGSTDSALDVLSLAIDPTHPQTLWASTIRPGSR